MNPNGYRSAFPTTEGQAEGLTKRELFAAMAMQMMIHPDQNRNGACKNVEEIMDASVRAADNLIDALNRRETK